MPPLFAPSTQYFATTTSCHPGAESVLVPPFPIVRLVRALHSFLPLVSEKTKKLQITNVGANCCALLRLRCYLLALRTTDLPTQLVEQFVEELHFAVRQPPAYSIHRLNLRIETLQKLQPLLSNCYLFAATISLTFGSGDKFSTD